MKTKKPDVKDRALIQKITGLAAKGLHAKQIATKLKMSETTVQKKAIANGIKLPRKTDNQRPSIFSDSRGALALKMRKDGKILSEIQAALKVKRIHLVEFLNQNGYEGFRGKKTPTKKGK